MKSKEPIPKQAALLFGKANLGPMHPVDTTMSFRLEIIDHSDYLFIKCFGVWNKHNARQVTDEMASAFFQSTHNAVLVDMREQPVEASITDGYYHGIYATDLFARTKHKIACLVREEDIEFDRFVENVFVNRGLIYRMFVNEQDAIDWIIGDTSTNKRSINRLSATHRGGG